MALLTSFSYYGRSLGVEVKSDFRDTYNAGSGQLKGRTLSRLKMLASLKRSEWNTNYAKPLSGICNGLTEIRFKADNVQQRPLGFHLTDTEFVLLYWAREKGSKFVPKTACEIALQRKAELLADGSLKHGLWLALE